MKIKNPLWLNEIYEKKSSENCDPHLELQVGHFIYLHKHEKNSNVKRVAIFRDGPFLPIKTGAAASILGMTMAMHARSNKYSPVLIKCVRPEDRLINYLHLPFDVLFLHRDDFYGDKSKILTQWMKENKIRIAHFDSAEAVNIHSKCIKNVARVVYEAHNIEHDLLKQLNAPKRTITYIKNQEVMACKTADLILFRSQENYNQLNWEKSDLAKKGKIYRGAVDVDKILFNTKRRSQSSNVIFLGHLNYQPNIEALDIIKDNIAPKIKNTIEIAGDVSLNVKRMNQHKNMKYLGRVEDLNKVFDNAYVAIAPLISGSGTRLKILDYMAAGLPVIATSLAIEGLESEIKKYIIIEDNFKNYPMYISNISKYITKDMLIKGRQYVVKKRTWKYAIVDIMNAYDSLDLL